MKKQPNVSHFVFLGTLLSLFVLPSPWSAASAVSTWGGARFSHTKNPQAPHTQAEVGGTFQFDLLPFWHMEMGFFLSSQKNLITSSSGSQSAWKWGVLKVPVWYVFTPIHWVSAGLGVYASIPTTIQKTDPVLSRSGLGISSMASLQYPLGLRFLARLLFSYQWGLAAFGGTSIVQSFRDRHWSLLGGITFEIL